MAMAGVEDTRAKVSAVRHRPAVLAKARFPPVLDEPWREGGVLCKALGL